MFSQYPPYKFAFANVVILAVSCLADEGRSFDVCMIHDRAQISLSLFCSFSFIQQPSSSLLRLSHRHKVSQAHGTRFAATTLYPALFLGRSLSNAGRRPRLSIFPSAVRLSVSPLPSPPPLTPVSPPLSVCHETRVKTYLVRFARKGEETRERERKKKQERG